MNTEYRLGKASFTPADDGIAVVDILNGPRTKANYDLDLLYVECRFCGKPLLWEQGRTRRLVLASGIDTSLLDAQCMIVSDGCPTCKPDNHHIQLHVVRLASFTPQDLMLLSDNRGNA